MAKSKASTTVFRIIYVIVTLFSALMVTAAIDLEYAGTSAIFAFLAGVNITLFVKSFVKPKADVADAQIDATSAAPTSVPASVTSEQIIPLSGHGSLSQPISSVDEKGVGASSHDEQLTKLVVRSDDVFSTLRSLADHQASESADPDCTLLSSMLRQSGLMEEKGLDALSSGRLSRNEHFWIPIPYPSGDDADEVHRYDLAVAVEGALGLDSEVPAKARTHAIGTPEAARDISDFMCSLVDLYGKGRTPGKGNEQWSFRYVLSNEMECLRTPFRIFHRTKANLDRGVAFMTVEIPHHTCFSIITTTPAERLAAARAYAFRLMMLTARVAFGTSERIQRVVVNAKPRCSEDVILSVDVTRSNIESLLKAARSTGLDQGGFPQIDCVACSFDENGWFKTVEPFLDDEPELFHLGWKAAGVTAETPVPAELAQATGSKVFGDFCIDENESRVEAWDDIKDHLGDSTTSAVSELERLRSSAADITVVEAASRTIDGLVKGTLDWSNHEDLESTFISGGDLEQAFIAARKIADTDDHNPHEVIALLEPKIAPLLDFGAYLDDQTCVYRYFNNVVERITFNKLKADGRQVKCVPDAYFSCLTQLCTEYQILGEHDKAAHYSEELMRIGPTCVDAALTMVRIRENQSRIYDAVDILKAMLFECETVRGAAILLYRLAYMEWKLGNEQLTLACYQRCLEWDSPIRAMASNELEELMNEFDNLHLLDRNDVVPTLERAGIPAGVTSETMERMQRMAELACNAGFYHLSGILGTITLEFTHDDALRGVLKSLRASE